MPKEHMRDEVYEELRKEILAGKNTVEVLTALMSDGVYDGSLDYETQMKWIFVRAIELAQTPADAMKVFDNPDTREEPEMELAFDKALNLCAYKEEVEAIMEGICEWATSPMYEKWYLKIFKRYHELPCCPD